VAEPPCLSGATPPGSQPSCLKGAGLSTLSLGDRGLVFSMFIQAGVQMWASGRALPLGWQYGMRGNQIDPFGLKRSDLDIGVTSWSMVPASH
jgi:hypothetical protein